MKRILLIVLFGYLYIQSYAQVDTSPKFEGGNPGSFSQWISKNLRYPQDALESGIEGSVILSFTVSKTGDVKNIKIMRGICPSMDTEAMRLVSSSPKWQPAIKDGKPAEITYTIPVVFKNLDNNIKPAEFNGGNLSKFTKWVMSEIKLPKQIIDNKIGGLMKVSFVIDSNGGLTEVTLIQGVHPLLDKEVLKVLQASPAWLPAHKKGIPIPVTCSLPLYFSWD